jgi:hypothetical protein
VKVALTKPEQYACAASLSGAVDLADLPPIHRRQLLTRSILSKFFVIP